MSLQYGKYVKLRPSSDIPAVFDIKDLTYIYRFKDHINDVYEYMKYLYLYRGRNVKFDRDRKHPLLSDLMKRYKCVNTHLIIRLVEWQYTDNDGFYLRDNFPRVKDAIFICLATRDYIAKFRKK